MTMGAIRTRQGEVFDQTVFVVKHKPSGRFLPPIKRYKSATMAEPRPIARIFSTRGSALMAARWWAAGLTYEAHEYQSAAPYLVSQKVEGRKVEDLEIVPLILMQVDPAFQIGADGQILA